jgi:hypothetical protein
LNHYLIKWSDRAFNCSGWCVRWRNLPQETSKSPATRLLWRVPPKGKLRFYRRDADGQLQFVGENEIDHQGQRMGWQL